MSKIIIHKNAAGKFNFTITGDDVNENILATSHGQGYERKGDAISGMYALEQALMDGEIEHMTHAQYTEFKRKYRNQQARNRRARVRNV